MSSPRRCHCNTRTMTFIVLWMTLAVGVTSSVGVMPATLLQHQRASRLKRLQLMKKHTDEYRDMFPMPMSPAMHRRVLELRQLLRLENDELDEVRGTTPVRTEPTHVVLILPHMFRLCDARPRNRTRTNDDSAGARVCRCTQRRRRQGCPNGTCRTYVRTSFVLFD